MTCENCAVPEGFDAVVCIPVTAEEVRAVRETEVFSINQLAASAQVDRVVNRPGLRFRAAILRLPVPPPPIEVGCRVIDRGGTPFDVRMIEGDEAWVRFDDGVHTTDLLDALTHASDCPNHGSGT